MTGKHLEYLLVVFHSKLMTFVFKSFYAGGGLGDDGYRYKKAFFGLLPVIIPNKKQEKLLINKQDCDLEICDMYGLTEKERTFILSQ